MAEVFGRRNLPQYINTILTKKIEESLQNSRENSRIRNTSVNSHSQKIIPTNNIVQNKYQNSQNKTNRKVCFKQIIRNKKEDSQQKLAFTFNDSFKLIPAKKPNKINQVSIKSIKSLDSSFAWGGNEVQQNQLSLSIRYYNPQLHQCKLLINEILKKLKFFDDSRFTDKQLVSWLEGYFEKEQAIVGKVFLRPLHTYHNKKRKTQIQIQRNREMLYQKVGQKHKDSFRNSQRYVSSSQIEQYDRFLQNLYIEKSKIKMKQIEQNVTKKMSFVCKQIRQQQNNDYVCSLRKKPSDIANFITDLKTFENDLGSLKRITKMNRSRFQLLNDTDLQIEMQAVKLNQHSYELRKNRKVLIIYD